jgi:hypothetical protein
MSALKQAMTLVGQDPLPDDVREQLKELEPELHEFELEWIHEALAVNEMNQGLFDEEDEIIGGPDA